MPHPEEPPPPAPPASGTATGELHDEEKAVPRRHPLMHRTETIDYAICLEGEIWLVLDDSEVLMKAGDVCVQRGTNHAWSNRSDAPCFMCFVLIGDAITPSPGPSRRKAVPPPPQPAQAPRA